MIAAVLLGLVGIFAVAVGLLSMLAAVMPTFGGSNDAGSLPIGAVIFAAGIALIFCAGTLI